MTNDATVRARGGVRVAGVLAVLFGFVGVFAGLSGALTFVPYRLQNQQTLETASLLAALSAAGAAFSMAGVVYGWRLVHGRTGAWKAATAAAAACVGTVAAFSLLMPASTPSPVPSVPSVFALLAVVVAAYSLEVAILVAGRRAGSRGGPYPPGAA